MNRVFGKLCVLGGSLLALGATIGRSLATLSTPPTADWKALDRWYGDVGPDVAITALLHVVALLLIGWLVVATALELAAQAIPAATAIRTVADRIAPRMITGLGRGTAAASLAIGLSVHGSMPRQPVPSDHLATLHPMDPGTGSPTTIASEPEPSVPNPVPGPSTGIRSAPPRVRDVERGDNLWVIAVATLRDSLGRQPTAAETVPYWRQLIEANRDRLVHPDNPSLIFRGQQFLLPPIDATDGAPQGELPPTA